MKNKNPLYVVKKDYVEEAQGVLDLIIKKLNLTPIIEFLMALIKMLLENVKSYAAFEAISDTVEDIFNRIELFRKFSI